MGQYYNAVNLDKEEMISPHSFGDGAKLLEFGLNACGMMLALAILTSDGNGRGGGDLHVTEGVDDFNLVGSWAGDRIVICGDYADKKKWLSEEMIDRYLSQDGGYGHRFPEYSTPNLYSYSDKFFNDISYAIVEILIEDEYIKSDFSKTLKFNGDLPEKLKEKIFC